MRARKRETAERPEKNMRISEHPKITNPITMHPNPYPQRAQLELEERFVRESVIDNKIKKYQNGQRSIIQ